MFTIGRGVRRSVDVIKMTMKSKHGDTVTITGYPNIDAIGVTGQLCEDWRTYFAITSPYSMPNEYPDYPCFVVIANGFSFSASPDLPMVVI